MKQIVLSGVTKSPKFEHWSNVLIINNGANYEQIVTVIEGKNFSKLTIKKESTYSPEIIEYIRSRIRVLTDAKKETSQPSNSVEDSEGQSTT